MKIPYFLLFVLFSFSHNLISQSILELDDNQSMSIAGKGPGQDAAINPFMNLNSIAFVENLGKNYFQIRVQNEDGEVTKTLNIQPEEEVKVTLLKGHVLYFDSDRKTKATVRFKKLSE